MRYIRKGNIREYIVTMRYLTGKSNDFKITITNSFLVYFILQLLPTKYDLFKVSYNAHKDKWSINELMINCVQEEERQASNKMNLVCHYANLATYRSRSYASKGKKV